MFTKLTTKVVDSLTNPCKPARPLAIVIAAVIILDWMVGCQSKNFCELDVWGGVLPLDDLDHLSCGS